MSQPTREFRGRISGDIAETVGATLFEGLD
jgi:hypothetical protein